MSRDPLQLSRGATCVLSPLRRKALRTYDDCGLSDNEPVNCPSNFPYDKILTSD